MTARSLEDGVLSEGTEGAPAFAHTLVHCTILGVVYWFRLEQATQPKTFMKQRGWNGPRVHTLFHKSLCEGDFIIQTKQHFECESGLWNRFYFFVKLHIFHRLSWKFTQVDTVWVKENNNIGAHWKITVIRVINEQKPAVVCNVTSHINDTGG